MSTATATPEIILPTFKCNVCKHTWHPRIAAAPLRCAKCKSSYWARPAKKGGK